MLMQQDLCRPKRTHRGLSLAFIRRSEKEGEEGRKRQHWEKRDRNREDGREEGGSKTESMPSIKQEGLCSLKLVRAEPQGVYRKSLLMGCWGKLSTQLSTLD